MKTYKSHKTVKAAKITGVSYYARGENEAISDSTPVAQFSLGDDGCVTGVTHGWMKKHGGDYGGPDGVELVGGYYVEYEDGYVSWSPAEAFEGGYKELGAEAQDLPVAGYKPTQPQWAIDAVNQFKALEERTLRAAEALDGAAVDPRFLAIGKTQLQLAFMALNRAVFQPGRVALPEDSQGNLELDQHLNGG